MLLQDQNPKLVARRNRLLFRLWLPLAVVWVVGAWFVGAREVWQLMGPPGILLVVIGWWAQDPKKPFTAIAMGAVAGALIYLMFAR